MTSKILTAIPKRQSTLFYYLEASYQSSSVKNLIKTFSKNSQEYNYRWRSILVKLKLFIVKPYENSA